MGSQRTLVASFAWCASGHWLQERIQAMAVQPSTNMVAGLVPRPARNDSTVVTAWPAAMDLKNDIFMNGKVDTFVRQLNNALRTRGMLAPILQRPATLADVQAANPLADASAVQQAFDGMLAERQDILGKAAANLPNVIKLETLSLQEQAEINNASDEQDAPALYELIMEHVDLSQGKAQDMLRQKFCDIKINRTDSIARVRSAVNHGARANLETPATSLRQPALQALPRYAALEASDRASA